MILYRQHLQQLLVAPALEVYQTILRPIPTPMTTTLHHICCGPCLPRAVERAQPKSARSLGVSFGTGVTRFSETVNTAKSCNYRYYLITIVYVPRKLDSIPDPFTNRHTLSPGLTCEHPPTSSTIRTSVLEDEDKSSMALLLISSN